MAIKGGTRLRHIHGPNLEELQVIVESFPFKVEIMAINPRPNGEWFIHFLIPETAFEGLEIQTVTEVVKPKIKRKPI